METEEFRYEEKGTGTVSYLTFLCVYPPMGLLPLNVSVLPQPHVDMSKHLEVIILLFRHRPLSFGETGPLYIET